jgi:hypothetical protein
MNSAVKDINEYLRSVRSRLGHLPKDECSAILDNLEAQIQEALSSRCKGVEPTPEDVKAVLAEMDPPEAFDTVSSEVPGAGPRPDIGKAALYISVVGIILSMVLAILYICVDPPHSGAKLNQESTAGFVVATLAVAYLLVIPSQVLAIIVAAFSKGDRLGRKAIVISTTCLVLWLVLLVLGWVIQMILPHA